MYVCVCVMIGSQLQRCRKIPVERKVFALNIYLLLPSREHIPPKWHFEDHFPFPKAGYVNSLEGIVISSFVVIVELPETNSSHPPRKPSPKGSDKTLPTIHFQVRLVSCRERPLQGKTIYMIYQLPTILREFH